MAGNVTLFVFLAAITMAVFAFLSVAVWVGAHSEERKTRDRYALLKSLAEQPGESAIRVLEMLREQEQRRAEQKEQEERRGYLIGGLTTVAAGAGLAVMLAALATKPGTWTVGLIPLLVGMVLTVFGLAGRRGSGRSDRGEPLDTSAR